MRFRGILLYAKTDEETYCTQHGNNIRVKVGDSMQDRYAGDIGDYGKIALLKSLQAQGLSVGINWYKVDALDVEKKGDGSFKQEDGKYLIPEELRPCDETLADKLLDISRGEDRSIAALEKANLIPEAVYYRESILVGQRAEWHQRALEKLKKADIVFVDPDNGMLVKSVGRKSVRSVKYVFYEEVHDYITQGHSVLIYNHRCRKTEEKYFHDICEKLQESTGVEERDILKITFPKCSVRDYLAVPISKDHSKKIQNAFFSMTQGMWGRLGVCRIPR